MAAWRASLASSPVGDAGVVCSAAGPVPPNEMTGRGASSGWAADCGEGAATGGVVDVVVDGGASLRRALVGGNLGAAAARNGWAGVVVNGCVRDVAELALCQTGIRALAPMPLPTEKRNEGQRDVAVQIQGVWVRPGDWLYADEDGMVVSATALHA